MNIGKLESSIIELQQELNSLTSKGNLTNQHILRISTELDDLIVQYLNAVSMTDEGYMLVRSKNN